jgi:DNA-binding NtrC family response regulator
MVHIKVPRLADRKEDLPLLLGHFLDEFARRYNKPGLTMSRRAQAAISRYNWPGNVRELENVLSYCAMMTPRQTIDIQDLPDSLREPALSSNEEEESILPLYIMNRKYAEKVLLHTKGNRAKAADLLGISRTTLYRMLMPHENAPAPEVLRASFAQPAASFSK